VFDLMRVEDRCMSPVSDCRETMTRNSNLQGRRRKRERKKKSVFMNSVIRCLFCVKIFVSTPILVVVEGYFDV